MGAASCSKVLGCGLDAPAGSSPPLLVIATTTVAITQYDLTPRKQALLDALRAELAPSDRVFVGTFLAAGVHGGG